jgi:hypothetical protein
MINERFPLIGDANMHRVFASHKLLRKKK